MPTPRLLRNASLIFLLAFVLAHGPAQASNGSTGNSGSPGTADTFTLNPNDQLEETPWSILLYRGWTSTETLLRTLRLQYDYADEDMYSVELAYMLRPENAVSQFFQKYLRARFQLAGNLGYRDGIDTSIWEGDLYFIVRWQDLPWNHWVPTTFAIGEGLSYTSDIPPVEVLDAVDQDEEPRKLLNYLMFEATIAHPAHPDWQLVARIHHRSAIKGVFSDGNLGSNVVGIGIRHYF